MGKLNKAVAALKRRASSLSSRIRKRKKGNDMSSDISIDSSSSKSSNYRSPTVEDAEDEDDRRSAAPTEDAEPEEAPTKDKKLTPEEDLGE